MVYAESAGRLFSISDDGYFVINDLHEGKVAQEYR